MGNSAPSSPLWKDEEKLSVEERRQRYRCKDKYLTEDVLEKKKWNILLPTVLDTLQTKTLKENARQLVLADRLDIKKKERKDKAKESSGEKKEENEKDKQRKEERKKFKQMQKDNKKKEKAEELVPIGKFVGSDAVNSKISLIQCDITTLEIDAIVNAANESLLGGGGIDGAIHKASGKSLYDECKTLNGCDTGYTKITRGYDLPSTFVLHTVGPRGPFEKELTSCYQTCLSLVKTYHIKTVAFCGISTGIFGYPLYSASHVALKTIREWMDKNHKHVQNVVICTFLDKEMDCYQKLMPLYFPPSGKTTDDVLKLYSQASESYKKEEDDSLDKEIDKILDDLEAEKKKKIQREIEMEKRRKEEKEKREKEKKEEIERRQQQLKLLQEKKKNWKKNKNY